MLRFAAAISLFIVMPPLIRLYASHAVIAAMPRHQPPRCRRHYC